MILNHGDGMLCYKLIIIVIKFYFVIRNKILCIIGYKILKDFSTLYNLFF